MLWLGITQCRRRSTGRACFLVQTTLSRTLFRDFFEIYVPMFLFLYQSNGSIVVGQAQQAATFVEKKSFHLKGLTDL